jgi:hypothetical protein
MALGADGQRAQEIVVVPAPRMSGRWIVVQEDVFADAVIGGRIQRGRALWRFRASCRDGRCSGALLEYPSPSGATRVRLGGRGKVLAGTRRYALPDSASCEGRLHDSRWTTRIRLVVTRSRRAGGDRPEATRFAGIARHQSEPPSAIPCPGGRLVTRLRARRVG